MTTNETGDISNTKCQENNEVTCGRGEGGGAYDKSTFSGVIDYGV